MDDRLDEERAARIRAARQVLAGNEIETPQDLFKFGHDPAALGPIQVAYLAGLVGLLLVGLLLWALAGALAASVVFFLLAVALLAAWAVLAHR